MPQGRNFLHGSPAIILPKDTDHSEVCPPMDLFCVFSRGIDETSKFATMLSSFLRPGDAVILTGTLAAGKTYFVKALARALGCTDLVTSPTYAIANFYDTKSGSLLHIDLYRISGLTEFRDLGLEEYFPESITVVEWGDLIAEEFPHYLSIAFDFTGSNDDHRKLTFSCAGERWVSEMELLKRRFLGSQE